MSLQKPVVQRLSQARAARSERTRSWFAGRIGRVFLGGAVTVLTGLSLLVAGLAGCSASKSAAGKPAFGPLFPKEGESKAEREALKKAVDKDPFPRAKSRTVDLDP